MAPRNLPVEYRLNYLCARLELFPAIERQIRDILNKPVNWDKIIEVALRQETLPFFYYNLNKLGLLERIPPGVSSKMKDYYYANLNRNLRIQEEIFSVLDIIDSRTQVVPFKGFHLIQTLYHNPGLRMMTDVDILVKESAAGAFRDKLIGSGYRANEPGEITVFTKTVPPGGLKMIIDAHTELAPARPYKIDLPQLWQRTREITVNGRNFPVLSPEDTFLYLALHLRRHTRRPTLKFIIDTAEILNLSGNKLDWPYIAKAARNNHIMLPGYLSLYLAKELLGAEIPPAIMQKFRPNFLKSAFIKLTINKHNFFAFKKWRGAILRFLLFDSFKDFIIYLYSVSLLERFVNKRRVRNARQNIRNEKPISAEDKIKK